MGDVLVSVIMPVYNQTIEKEVSNMKLAIMQPYLFPYIGYYSLIDYVDYFIFFDTPQYIRKGWINRNRILKSDGTPTYFTVPIENCVRETPINKVKIDMSAKWKEKILGQLTVYKKRAPFYAEVIDLVRDVFDETEMMAELSMKSVMKSCQYLGLKTKFDVFSQMEIIVQDVDAPDEWALKITEALGYQTYVNPPGGLTFFDRNKYEHAGIELQFLETEIKRYNQRMGRFEPGLSIIDMMMFLSSGEIRELLKCYEIR